MKINKIFAAITLIGTLSAPAIVLATPLTIVNNTSEYSTTVTNGNGFCSSRLPGGSGITHPHSTNTVGEWTLKLACVGNLENCQSDVYMTNNCTGPVVAKVVFSVSTGIKSVTPAPGTNYKMSGTGFHSQIDYAS